MSVRALTSPLPRLIAAAVVIGSLERFETPQKIKIVGEVWTPDTGLVTDSLKLRRKQLSDYYKSDVDRLYQ